MLSCIFSLLYNPVVHGCKKKDAFFHKIDPCPENFGIMEKIQWEIRHFPQGSLDRTLTKE